MVLRFIKFTFFGALLLLSANPVLSQVTTGELDQNAEQSGGQYQPMNMGYAGFNSLGMTQSAWLDPLQNLGEGQTKPAYSKYFWSPDLVLPVRLREGMITLINFPSWEMVEDVFIGDNATFDGQISGPSTLLLYPRKGANVGVDTNIIIFGRSGNRYVFYAKSEGVNTERLTNSIIDIDVIGGQGGTGGSAAGGSAGGARRGGSASTIAGTSRSADSTFTKRFQKEDWLKEIPFDPAKLRFDVEVYVPNPDDVVIAPERVWRDDIFTYIDLGKKSLNMNQRPIVTMIVERLEVPVGFRTKGPDNRLIIVEGVGDMVMRNGKRLICLKLRRDDSKGLDGASYADDMEPSWDVAGPIPEQNNRNGNGGANSINSAMGKNYGNGFNGAPGQYDIQVGGGELVVPNYGQNGANQDGNVNINYQQPTNYEGASMGKYDYSKMQRLHNKNSGGANLKEYGYGSGFSDTNSNISIELGTDGDVSNMEKLWDNLSSKYSDTLGGYDPFFSVDAPADGQGKELFHLRVGPIKSLEEGDAICGKLGRNGVFCSVVRTQ